MRIAGIELPDNKRAEIALTYIYGIGRPTAGEILEKTQISKSTKVRDLTNEQINQIRLIIENDLTVEGDLRREVQLNIKRMMDLGTYRGLRHRRGLPVRGQRTKTNSRTRKGPRRIAVKKKK